jgi:hypothetical protein
MAKTKWKGFGHRNKSGFKTKQLSASVEPIATITRTNSGTTSSINNRNARASACTNITERKNVNINQIEYSTKSPTTNAAITGSNHLNSSAFNFNHQHHDSISTMIATMSITSSTTDNNMCTLNFIITCRNLNTSDTNTMNIEPHRHDIVLKKEDITNIKHTIQHCYHQLYQQLSQKYSYKHPTSTSASAVTV